jgi:hypothetical protein
MFAERFSHLTQIFVSNDGALADYASKQLGGSLFYEVHLKRWNLLLDRFSAPNGLLEHEYRKIELEWIENVNDKPCELYKNAYGLKRIILDVLEIASKIVIENKLEMSKNFDVQIELDDDTYVWSSNDLNG